MGLLRCCFRVPGMCGSLWCMRIGLSAICGCSSVCGGWPGCVANVGGGFPRRLSSWLGSLGAGGKYRDGLKLLLYF